MNELIGESGYFGFVICILAYILGVYINRKTKFILCNPLLIAVVLVIFLLIVTKIDYSTFSKSTTVLSWLLTPATVCLAIPLYEQIELLKKNSTAIIAGITAGVIASIGSIALLAIAFGLTKKQFFTMLPKSVTTAIGMGISSELGGNPSISATLIVLTGIVGNIIAETFLKIVKITNPIAKGIAIGSASHVIGTSKAMQLGSMEGAMSSLSIVVSGLITVICSALIKILV